MNRLFIIGNSVESLTAFLRGLAARANDLSRPPATAASGANVACRDVTPRVSLTPRRLRAMFNVETRLLRLAVALAVVCGGLWASAGNPPVAYTMSSGNYFENFADIANWTANFAGGTGAGPWGSYPITSGGSANDGVRTTKSSATFVTGTAGGVQKGTLNLVFLSTGSGTPSEAVAVDLLLDFTGRTAGTLSFDWAAIDNSSGTRPTSLRVFWSTDGSTFTEITAAQSLNVQSPSSGSITTVALPASFNNSATARLRFYNHAGTVTGSGNRDKISIDNVAVTSTAASPAVTIDNTGTPMAGNVTAGASDMVLFGFRLTPSASVDFTGLTLTKAGTTTSTDLSNFQVVYDADNSGTYNSGDSIVSDTKAIGSTIAFVISGQSGIAAARRYLVIADVAGGATPSRTFTGSIAVAGDVTTTGTESGTAAGNAMTIVAAAFSSASDIIRDATFTEPPNIAYGSYQETDLTSSSLQVGQFTIRDGGGSADADSVSTTLDAITFTVANGANLRRVAIYDGTTERAEVAGGASVVFSGLSGLVAADGGTKTFKVLASFNASVTDNHQLSLTVSSATANSGGSTFAAGHAGAAATDTTSDRNRIEVTATKMVFSTEPTTCTINQDFTAAVQAQDANNNVDLDNAASVTISKASGSGTLSAAGGLTKSLSSGAQTWVDLRMDTAGSFTIHANDGGALTDVTSASITASAGPTTLTAGDIAVIGYNTSGSPDNFAILVLKDLGPGTVFYVNDNEVTSDGDASFTDLSEAEASFTVKAGQTITAGTVIMLPWQAAAVSTSTYDWNNNAGSPGLGNANEEIYIYTAAAIGDLTPTAFIFGTRIGSSTSARPSGLTAGTTWIMPTGSASRYKTTGATYTGTQAALLTAIGNTAANWEATAPGAAGDWTFNVVTLASEPTTHASAVNFNGVGPNGMTVNWTTGNGVNCIVVARAGAAPTGTPTDGMAYTANATYGTGGTALGDGFVVYNGDLETVTLSGLSVGTTYYVKIFEYNGSGATAN